jgi:hypothetical protein
VAIRKMFVLVERQLTFMSPLRLLGLVVHVVESGIARMAFVSEGAFDI